MIRNRKAQDAINQEIDRRLLELQTPREIAASVKTCAAHICARSRKLKMRLHRITDEEREHLMVRRKVGA
jgi:hypothetical protein